MDHSEQIAKGVMEFLIPGAVMHYREDQSTSIHDFDLERLGELVAAVEVTTSTDEQRRGTIAAIQDTRKDRFIPTKRCRKDWIVYPLPTANINKNRRELDRYLAEIETAGLKRFLIEADFKYPAVRRIYQDLHIEHGYVTKWKKPGYIALTLPGGGGKITPEHVQEAVKREAWKDDNRKKLNLAGSKERHLFVYVDDVDYLPWASLRDTDPSALELPQLPPEITHVWVAAQFSPYDAAGKVIEYHRVWRARRGEKWEDLGEASMD
ncbi:MAG: hypothetical protein OXC18_18665 [Desulfurellaceae bacterium]|nr:hypothetical protein [Desulfurellaceae bacterium]